MAKPKLWLGLTTTSAALLILLVAGRQVAFDNEMLVNDALHLSTQKIDKIDSDVVEGSAYKDENGSLSDDGWKRMISDSYKYCREAVEQGSVLFKNAEKDGKKVLPLADDERNVTLFGRGSRNLFMRSGAGGAAPNDGTNNTPDLVVRLDKAFEDNKFNINRTVFDLYTKESNMTTPSTTVEASISIYTNAVKESFSNYSDAAIVTFVRIGTEDSDPSVGKLELDDNEANLLKMIKDSGVFKKTIVLINSPMPMAMDWVDKEEYGVDAVVYMGVPGYYGAEGIVHVLMGKDKDGKVVNASGHAPDTFAASSKSSPAIENFGTRSISVYKENVYVGYKYYETRYEDLILGQGNADSTKGTQISSGAWDYADEMGYPFGYGLSYTTFEQKLTSLKYNENDDTIDAKVEVKNTGDMDGKASVQLYVKAPYTDFDKQNGLGKSAIALMAYEKVDVAAGKTETVELSFDRYFLTTYDYVNEYQNSNGEQVKGRYILEGGDYYFALGNGAHEALNNALAVSNPEVANKLYDHEGNSYTANTNAVKKLAITQDPQKYAKSIYSDVEVSNQFDDADYNYMAEKNNKDPIKYLDRQDWEGTYPTKTTASPATSDDTNMANYYSVDPNGEKYNKDNDGVTYNVEYEDENGKKVITFNDMVDVPLEGKVEKGRFEGKEGADIWDAFVKQMTLDELAVSVSDNRGVMGVLKIMKQGHSVAEGPEGLLSKYKYGDTSMWATGFPTGPTFTATFDHEMQKKFGGFYGEDALFCGVACVNAPGANIVRTPYTSRASEYMSEDGIMNYYVASNVVGEARRKGLIMNIKHCFLNNQENGRQGIETYCNEQAIREIYLKPFEGALTRGHGLGIMTSYNRIGARYAATHEPLMVNVMRGEWNYKGQIIDDAKTGSNSDKYANGPAMLHCGTDIFCLDGARGSQLASFIESNSDGELLKDLQRANKYVMYAMSRSWMGGVRVSEEEIKAAMNPWWKKTLNGVNIGAGAVTAILLGVYIFFEVVGIVKNAKSEETHSSEEVE